MKIQHVLFYEVPSLEGWQSPLMNSVHLCCNFIAFAFARKILYFRGILVEGINNSTDSLAYCLISSLSIRGMEVQNEKR